MTETNAVNGNNGPAGGPDANAAMLKQVDRNISNMASQRTVSNNIKRISEAIKNTVNKDEGEK